MASIYLGQFNGSSASYGSYNSYFQYDEAIRNGTTITLTNCKLYFERIGTGWTSNRLATSGSIAGQIVWSNVTLNPSGTQSPATMTYNIGTVNITGVDYTTSSISLSVQAKGTGASSLWTNTSGTVQLNYNGSISVPVINISTVSATNGNIGGNSAISINRYNSGFTHKLYYKFDGQSSNTLIASGVATGYDWTIPTSAFALIPNANSIGCTITCETYNGSTLIGSSTTTLTASVVNSNPEFDNLKLAYQDGNATTVAKTNNNQLIVRNLSVLKLTISPATAKNSATIIGYEVMFNGNTQTVQAGITDLGTVNLSQNTILTVRAVDSRGNKTEATKTIIIADWVLPQAQITAQRVNNFEDNTNIKANVTISSVENINSIQSLKYRYKKTTDTNYSNYYNLQNNVNVIVAIDKLYAWNFQIEITDKFGTTTYNFNVQKGVPIMFIDIDKLSVGIGKFPVNLASLDVDIINGFSIPNYRLLTTNDISNVLNGTSSTKVLSEASGKSLKDYYDSIYNLLKLRSQQPLGEFTIWEGNFVKTGNDTWSWLATFYSMKNAVLERYPLKSGYTRKVKLVIDESDNKSSGAIYLKLRNTGFGGSFSKEYLFGVTWGSTTDGVRNFKSIDINFDEIPLGHMDIDVTPDFATDGVVRFYRIYFIIYDEII